jgi:hypothetical protein
VAAVKLTPVGAQVIVDDYVKSEAVLKESRMHAELDLDGDALCIVPSAYQITCPHPWSWFLAHAALVYVHG